MNFHIISKNNNSITATWAKKWDVVFTKSNGSWLAEATRYGQTGDGAFADPLTKKEFDLEADALIQSLE